MGDSGFMWMNTTVLDGAMAVLGKLGEGLGDDWEAISRAMRGRLAGIGAGDLADAFRDTYDNPAMIMRTSAGQTPAIYRDLAGAGVVGTTIYIGGNTIVADSMPR